MGEGERKGGGGPWHGTGWVMKAAEQERGQEREEAGTHTANSTALN